MVIWGFSGPPARAIAIASASESRKVNNAYGFDVDARVRIAAHDRKGLERLARYMLRPPLSKDRIERLGDGRYRIRLKKPWRDGTTDLVLDGAELVGRLAALVPPPRAHLTRYFGVFAPRAKLRRLIVPRRNADLPCHASPSAEPKEDAPQRPERRTSWATLLARVFAVDVLACPRCSSRMQRIEWCTHPARIRAVLAATGPPGDLECVKTA
jgi:Putative transposase